MNFAIEPLLIIFAEFNFANLVYNYKNEFRENWFPRKFQSLMSIWSSVSPACFVADVDAKLDDFCVYQFYLFSEAVTRGCDVKKCS